VEATARAGLDCLAELSAACGIPAGLAALGIPRAAIPRLAAAAVQVTRLLKNNPREVAQADAEAIYQSAYGDAS
jgi:alcohol dehydrogenase class IV